MRGEIKLSTEISRGRTDYAAEGKRRAREARRASERAICFIQVNAVMLQIYSGFADNDREARSRLERNVDEERRGRTDGRTGDAE